MKHLITLMDWAPEDIREVLDLAHATKKKLRDGPLDPCLAGLTLALVFEKSSMRTRVSFQVAMTQLGGTSLYLSKADVNLGEREPVKDGARVLSRYVDGVAARVYAHATVEELAAHSTIPIVNALSNEAHPCQALADMMTVQENFEDPSAVTVAYVGDANNVAVSLATICAKLGVAFRIASPAGYQLDEQFVKELQAIGSAPLLLTDSPAEAVERAQVIYTDTWVSMGQEDEAQKRLKAFQGYCVDDALASKAAPDAIVMHCLPAHRGSEITEEVIEGARSAVFDEAENRLHAKRALLQLLMGG